MMKVAMAGLLSHLNHKGQRTRRPRDPGTRRRHRLHRPKRSAAAGGYVCDCLTQNVGPVAEPVEYCRRLILKTP